MEGDDWPVKTHSPQHEHPSDGEDDVESDSPIHHTAQELGYHTNIITDGGVYRGSQALHHRTNANRNVARTPTREGNGAGIRPVTGSRANRSNLHKGRQWRSLFRGSFVLGIIGYFVLMILQSLRLSDSEYGTPSQLPLFDRRGMSAMRQLLDKKRVDDRRKALVERERHAVERLGRTRPPETTDRVSAYEIISMDERQQPVQPKVSSSPATLDELCGIHAKNASLAHPNLYLSKDVLNSKSRVMITGILNPIGFHLALALKERCGVQVMTGIDPMFPNTVVHRLQLQERIQLLTTNIPKLVQPIVLPLVGLDPRLNTKQENEPSLLPMTGEISLLNFRPTHIVHLASYSPAEYMDPLNPQFWNQQSPYVTADRSPPLYRIRSSLTSMEQILASIVSADNDSEAQRPHLTYASSLDHPDPVHVHLKLADELLADTYHSLHSVYSVGLRLPNAVYGPWGRAGTSMHQLADTAVEHWNSTIDSDKLLESAGLENVADRVDDFVYVSGACFSHLSPISVYDLLCAYECSRSFSRYADVVDALIAAMQFRSESQSPMLFEVSPESRVQLSSVASAVQSFISPGGDSSVKSLPAAESTLMQRTQSFLQWKPAMTLRNGMMKMLAWHLDKEGSSKAQTDHSRLTGGDVFLKQQGVETCAVDDNLCHSGRKVLPCASECVTKANCIPSIFDDVSDLTRSVTEECDFILYTQSLGYDVKDIRLQAMYSDEGEQLVCNFAFIPRESTLVDAVIKKVPEEQLKKFGVSSEHAPTKRALRDLKLDGLNGRLLYKGWILLWVKDATKPLSTFDNFLLKLNPGNFFSKDVKQVLFVDEKFPVSPNIEDVLFLMGESHREPLGYRALYRKDENGKKIKYKLQPEPERRAVILLAPLKQRASHDSKETALADGQKLTVLTATKYMRYEIGEDAALKEGAERKKQREFYERVPTFVNRVDLRSPEEPWYRYEMKHWIRTRWIVHDMELEASRELRCDWYQEHMQWGNELDQLSFAHVMARRELERRISHHEPDDHVKPPHVEHPELKLLTDAHEWHPYMGKEHRLDSLGAALEKVPDHMASKDDEEDGEVESEPVVQNLHGNKVPLFVRIMSERIMMFARQKWARERNLKMNKKKRRKGRRK